MNIRKDQWMAQVWDTNKSPKDPKYEARTKKGTTQSNFNTF